MPRAHRQHAPGSGVHITARIQSGEKLFTPLQESVAEHLCEAAQLSGALVLALVVMPNHLHIVVKQGTTPLGWMMQRALQRTTILVRKHHPGEGHIFGRRYWSCVCDTPNYVRQAIVYTHLNPWKADLCGRPEDYVASSAHWFKNAAPRDHWAAGLARVKSRYLFARESFSDDDIDSNYDAFIEFSKKRYRESVGRDISLFDWSSDPTRPYAPRGDEHWVAEYTQVPPVQRRRVQKRDVRDHAVAVLRMLDPSLTIDLVRGSGKSRAIVRIRRDLVATLLTQGYRGSAIARLLYVSQATVSDVARQLRLGMRISAESEA